MCVCVCVCVPVNAAEFWSYWFNNNAFYDCDDNGVIANLLYHNACDNLDIAITIIIARIMIH